MEQVQFKPLLDNVLVREIPYEDYRKKITGLETPDKYQGESDRGVIVAVGGSVTEVKPGDVVQYDEFGKKRIYLHPEDRHKTGLPVYYKLRVADIEGVHAA